MRKMRLYWFGHLKRRRKRCLEICRRMDNERKSVWSLEKPKIRGSKWLKDMKSELLKEEMLRDRKN